MFGSLKKKLKESVEKLTKRIEEPLEIEKNVEEPKIEHSIQEPEIEEPKMEESRIEEPEIRELEIEELPESVIPEKKPEIPIEKPKERKGLGIRRITTKEFSVNDIDNFFQEAETELLQANVALEVIDALKDELKNSLVGKQIKRGEAEEMITQAFEDALVKIVDQGSFDLESKIDGQLKCIFLGFNGSGKTTTIAKIADYLKKKGHKPVMAAGDTFRAAAVEQLEYHGNKLGIKVVKHKYGADSAAVFFDAVKYAEANGCDVVLGDTAGRTQANKNLMAELEKIVRVNKPDLKILIVDSLTGNDAIDQAKEFDKLVGVDAVVMTKTDVNQKGGSILSVCYAIKKPILFLGTGQDYEDIKRFDPKEFVHELLS
ncbi:MAG: signal recognition particle-docking protein FtsY [Candidatus Aenigmatarchaeota archaeon]